MAGTVTIRVDLGLHRILKARADSEGRKIQWVVDILLREGLKLPAPKVRK